ncbi:unnamed protein product, partial [Rotaria socialis]
PPPPIPIIPPPVRFLLQQNNIANTASMLSKKPSCFAGIPGG